MLQSEVEHRSDMLVIEAVKNHFAVSASTDDAQLTEAFQMLRNGGLLHFQQHAEVADTRLRQAQGPYENVLWQAPHLPERAVTWTIIIPVDKGSAEI